MSGNVGHQAALLAGLAHATTLGDAIIYIDADFQDDIHVIPAMVDHWKAGCDIVYGVRKGRETDTLFKRNSALMFYRLMSRRAVEALLAYRERNLYLRGIVPLLGYRSTQVFYDRKAREAGVSKYPLKKMLAFAVDGITSFSVKPVRMVLFMGLVFILISLLILVYVLHALIAHHSVSGWASLMLSIWFVGGVLLVGLGIVGEYIGKIYLEVKNRPRYNVDKELI